MRALVVVMLMTVSGCVHGRVDAKAEGSGNDGKPVCANPIRDPILLAATVVVFIATAGGGNVKQYLDERCK